MKIAMAMVIGIRSGRSRAAKSVDRYHTERVEGIITEVNDDWLMVILSRRWDEFESPYVHIREILCLQKNRY